MSPLSWIILALLTGWLLWSAWTRRKRIVERFRVRIPSTWRVWLGVWLAGCVVIFLGSIPLNRTFVVATHVDDAEQDYPDQCLVKDQTSLALSLALKTKLQHSAVPACFPGQRCPARDWPFEGREYLVLAWYGWWLGFAFFVAFIMGVQAGNDAKGGT